MKKQFNRMKQLANQTVGRAEKTEVLSDDLLQIERRMEMVRQVSHNTHKRMVTCLQGHIGTDAEKRQKKLPQTALSQAMLDGAGQLGDESLISKTMEICGDVENRLASELMQHEVQIEKEVLDPLNQLAEVEIPNIMKQRKQLAKLVLDYDSAKARWLQQNKSMVSTTNSSGLTAKVEALKEEVDEAMNKVEICKDQLAADMYTFSSKEGDYARYYVTLLEAQADFHRRALSLLDQVLPSIRTQQDSWMEKPAFGTSLSEHLKRSGREIALPIEACVMMLLETGMKEEGLFRIAAGASKLKKLKAALDCSTSQLEEFYSDPHAVAGALKSYLRELPEPLMTFELYEDWIQASNMSDPDKRLQALWVTCDSLPKHNKANFRYLVKFLARLAQDSEVNKMTPSNIAIVLGPNLLWAKTEGSLAEMAAATSVHVMTIIEPIIQHADWFFPDDVDFNVSGMFVMPSSTTISTSFLTPTDMDFGTTEKKRPVSMAVLDSDSPRRDSLVNKLLDHTPRRANTYKKPLASPAFQPPLPPAEGTGVTLTHAQVQPMGSGQEVLSSESAQGAETGVTLQELPTQRTEVDSTTSPVQKNGFSGGLPANPYGAGSSSGPLSVPQPGARAPSPLMVRKGVKKPAPAPPKPTNPPPGQASSQPIASSSAAQPSASLAKPISSSSPSGQSLTPPSSTARRHSTNQLPIQAPNHPPPQPPMQVTPPLQPKAAATTPGTGESSADPSPPSTPTPPDTPPPDTGLPDISYVSPVSPSYQFGSLPRPRPVPKPRHRPSVPPPPQPATHGSDGTNGVCRSTSKISTETLTEESPDGAQVLTGLSRTLEFTVEPPAVSPELESESTAL
ncbi:rho GTPase-activating protein 17b isoform X1 [Brienomyrus brachyistius]|uniref:rho GTPase-activating protein 17b isoform X1 n=1 Tax=Brienomyrus brachyistius TaxID=42636 RepID=UPI0020B1CC74|nr:rho GTPase-activating protein 17b isoform X1 [Brienomyrus brachyistius]